MLTVKLPCQFVYWHQVRTQTPDCVSESAYRYFLHCLKSHKTLTRGFQGGLRWHRCRPSELSGSRPDFYPSQSSASEPAGCSVDRETKKKAKRNNTRWHTATVFYGWHLFSLHHSLNIIISMLKLVSNIKLHSVPEWVFHKDWCWGRCFSLVSFCEKAGCHILWWRWHNNLSVNCVWQENI